MDLRESLDKAKIKRVAIIDDDLSNAISMEDLRRVSEDGLDQVLADPHDPERMEYLRVLESCGRNLDKITDLAEPLSDENIRKNAPVRLRKAAEDILGDRHRMAAPMQLIRKLLLDAGIEESGIEMFFSTDNVPHDKGFDLFIVDYYLVNDEKEKTISFVEHIIGLHAEQEKPLQIILMSSHEDNLKRDFHDLRPRIQTSSSRMRILAKPKDYAQLARWKITLIQLAREREHVNAIESFTKNAIDAVRRAADKQSKKLWNLDLHAMKMLYETSCADNDDFIRYVEECLSRYLLTHLEKADGLSDALEKLRNGFEQDDMNPISAGAEIGDSHAAIQEVMSSMVWRGGGIPTVPEKPTDSTEDAEWIQRLLRFGMVLRDPDGRLWLNLTQSCDLAQVKAEKLADLSLLLIAGEKTNPTKQSKSDKFVHVSALMPGDEPKSITWNLQRINTQPVSEFAADFSDGWSVMGELRVDQAQHVMARYSAQAARVGLQRAVRSWKLSGRAMTAAELQTATAANGSVSGFPVEAHARPLLDKDSLKKKKCMIYFELSMYEKLQKEFPGEIKDSALRICDGVDIQPEVLSKNEPRILYCETAKTNIELHAVISKNGSQKKWLAQERNAKKLIIAVWPAT